MNNTTTNNNSVLLVRRSCLSPCSSVCSDSTKSSSSSSSNLFRLKEKRRHVCFTHLSIREYELGLGDHPCVSSGPPVSISWKYIPETESCMTVDEYESSRPPRRCASQMIMPRALRESLLEDIVEYTPRDIQEAIRKAKQIKIQRQRTVRKLNTSPYEEMLKDVLYRMKQMVALGQLFAKMKNKKKNQTTTSTTSTYSIGEEEDTTTMEH